MNKKYLFIIFIVFFLLSLFIIFYYNITAFHSVKHDFQPISDEQIKSFPKNLQPFLIWPDEIKIKNSEPDNKENPYLKYAIEGTNNWINKIFQDEWIHPDLKNMLIPMKSGINEIDIIIVRYRIKGYIIQMILTSKTLTIIIYPFHKRTKKVNRHKKTLYVNEIIQKFLKESTKIESINTIEDNYFDFPNGFTLYRYPRIKSPNIKYWWNTITWISDGKTVILLIKKEVGRLIPIEFPFIESWFSSTNVLEKTK